MDMLSNIIQYLARNNKKFLSRSSGYKGSRKEDQKNCFNCKKPRHFIVDCRELQKEKSKEKSKKPTFKSNKFRKQIKQGLIATWEDLDNESGSDNDDAEDEANVALGLVATEASDAEPETNSKDKDEVYSKIPRDELVESLKELLTHFEHRTNELKYLKEKYVDSSKQQEKTMLDLKESEKELQSFDFICRTYEDNSSIFVKN